jgi:predicted lipoprotein with Yx(FWY)xxD motif
MRLAGPTVIGSSVVAAVLLVAGCGGGGGGSSSAPPASKPPGSGSALVNSSTTASLGDFLVGPNGHTLYVFLKDTGPKSTCSGACANDWPPLTTTGKLTTGAGVSASALKTERRSDGTMQVTFDGHPLYYYAGDLAPADVNGQGLDMFGAKWFALTPTGKPITSVQGPFGGY